MLVSPNATDLPFLVLAGLSYPIVFVCPKQYSQDFQQPYSQQAGGTDTALGNGILGGTETAVSCCCIFDFISYNLPLALISTYCSPLICPCSCPWAEEHAWCRGGNFSERTGLPAPHRQPACHSGMSVHLPGRRLLWHPCCVGSLII